MRDDYVAGYVGLHESGELKARAAAACKMLASCELCPRRCRANRLEEEVGACRTGAEPRVSSFGPHFGEERPLVGSNGSGTIFLTNCNLDCVFCQNYDISALGHGEDISVEALADIMLSLQRRGCHNINWVSPTHQLPQLLSALVVAAEQGLTRPIVYNCGGYEAIEALGLLEGIVDIYMPDVKYGNDAVGKELSGVADYWTRCQAALGEMHRQVGDLQIDAQGVARRGMLVRHLVLPNGQSDSRPVIDFLARLSKDTYLNIMDQYRPCHRAAQFEKINRSITREEYLQVLEFAAKAGLRRLDSKS